MASNYTRLAWTVSICIYSCRWIALHALLLHRCTPCSCEIQNAALTHASLQARRSPSLDPIGNLRHGTSIPNICIYYSLEVLIICYAHRAA
jgi:hypothetical protein